MTQAGSPDPGPTVSALRRHALARRTETAYRKRFNPAVPTSPRQSGSFFGQNFPDRRINRANEAFRFKAHLNVTTDILRDAALD